MSWKDFLKGIAFQLNVVAHFRAMDRFEQKCVVGVLVGWLLLGAFILSPIGRETWISHKLAPVIYGD